MRDPDAIDRGLQVLSAVLWSIRAHDDAPPTNQAGVLLDERFDSRRADAEAWQHFVLSRGR